MKKITVLGIACVDIIITGNYKIPDPGKLEIVEGMRLHTGGCALNCSIDLSKINIPHDLIIPIGNDLYGDFIIDSLNTYGISGEGVVRLKNCSTSSSIVLLNEKGERSFLHHPGANSFLDIGDIDLSIISDSDILFIGGALLMPNFDGNQMSELLKYAKNRGVYTVLDIAWDSMGEWMKTLEKVLPYVDLFVPSFDEACMLSGFKDLKKINKYFINKGVNEVIIKLGNKGSAYFQDDKVTIVPAIDVDNIKDTTGAGDSFISGLLTGLFFDWDTLKTIRFANTVGSLCVQEFGASGGIINLEDIIKIQERNYNNE